MGNSTFKQLNLKLHVISLLSSTYSLLLDDTYWRQYLNALKKTLGLHCIEKPLKASGALAMSTLKCKLHQRKLFYVSSWIQIEKSYSDFQNPFDKYIVTRECVLFCLNPYTAKFAQSLTKQNYWDVLTIGELSIL